MVTATEDWESVCVGHHFLAPWLSLMILMQFFIWGSRPVTLGPVMTRYEMSPLIGGVFSTGSIVSILSSFVLGMLVDRSFASQKVMAAMHLTGAAILWFIPQVLVAQSGTLLAGLLFDYTLCYVSALALTSNIAFHSLANINRAFPVVRVLGTTGWTIAGICIRMTGTSNTTGTLMPAAFCSVALITYNLTLPRTSAPAKDMPVQFRDPLCADAFVLLKTHHLLIFSLCAILISVPLSIHYTYTASYLVDVSVKDISTAMSFDQAPGIVFILVIPLLFRHLEAKYILLVDMAAWFVRHAFFVPRISEEGRFLFYLDILLYGVCYDFFSTVGFIYTDRMAGEKVKDQVQSMIIMFIYGIGMLLGSQISGALYSHLVAGQSVPQAQVTLWWVPAVVAVIIALVLLLSLRYGEREPH